MADNAQRTVAMLTERPKTPVRQAIDKLPIEKQWEVTENLSLHAMRHSLVISKRPVEKPKFNQDTLDWVPQFVPGSSLTKSGEVFMFARPGVGGLKLPPLAAAMISLASITRCGSKDMCGSKCRRAGKVGSHSLRNRKEWQISRCGSRPTSAHDKSR